MRRIISLFFVLVVCAFANGQVLKAQGVTRKATPMNVAARYSNPAVISYTSKKAIVNSIEEFWTAVDKAEEGDTISFYPGLRGKVLECPNSLKDKKAFTKALTILGNGVVLKNCLGWNLEGIKGDFTVDNVYFSNLTDYFYMNESNVTMRRCAFTNSKNVSQLFKYSDSQGKVDYKLRLENCRFSNDTISEGEHADGLVTITPIPDKRNITVEFISCTFVDNIVSPKSGVISLSNKPNIILCNNVFENNTNPKKQPNTIYSGDIDYVSKGYNVIEGPVVDAEKHLVSTDVHADSLKAELKLYNDEYAVLSTGDAFQHMPANTKIEGVTLPTTDIQGSPIDYTKPTHSGATQLVVPESKVDYTKGTFIVNEDWYGHQNSTVNFLTDNGEWVYRVIQKENPGIELGATNQYGAIYGDKLYLIAKQAQDPGATVKGGRVTICDAKTLKVLKQLEFIATDKDGKSIADGRGFLGVDENKGYIGSSNGIYILDLKSMEIKGAVKGTSNNGGSAYEQLYSGQIGNMVRVNDKVFAVHQSKGMLVIDAKADTISKVIIPANTWGFGSVVLSKDGNLWCSVSNPDGSGEAAPFIYKVNPATCDTTRIDVPKAIYPPANSWYAWTPDCFCASKQHNVIYWNGGENSWFSNKGIYKYDIDKNEFSNYIDLSNEDWMIYGCSFRVDPVSDDSYVSLFKDFQDPTYIVRKYNDEGKILAEHTMIENYWFPSLPVFPDNAAPASTIMDKYMHKGDSTFTVSFAGLVTDADNMDAAIIKTITNLSDSTIFSLTMDADSMIIKPLKNGEATITMHINSNGKLLDQDIAIAISGFTGINNLENTILRNAYYKEGMLYINGCNGYKFFVYDLSGKQTEQFTANADNYSRFTNLASNTYIIYGVKDGKKISFKISIR